MTLPIESYAGTYFHPGYLSMALEAAGSKSAAEDPRVELTARRSDATWPIECELEHVSGEYWLMKYSFIHNRSVAGLQGFVSVQFKLGPDGKVASMGIDWRSFLSESVEGLIWFDKVQ